MSVTVIVVEHRDRVARFGAEYVEAALSAQGRRLLVADPSEVDDDLKNRAARALAATGFADRMVKNKGLLDKDGGKYILKEALPQEVHSVTPDQIYSHPEA